MLVNEFPPDEGEKPHDTYNAQRYYCPVIEPIVLLAVFEYILKRSNKRCQKSNSPPVDLRRFEFFTVFRTPNKRQREERCDNPDGDVDVKDVRPGKVISDVSSERRTEGWRDNGPHSVDGLCHSAFGDRITLCDDGLRSYEQCAASQSLNKPENDKLPNVIGVSAKE